MSLLCWCMPMLCTCRASAMLAHAGALHMPCKCYDSACQYPGLHKLFFFLSIHANAMHMHCACYLGACQCQASACRCHVGPHCAAAMQAQHTHHAHDLFYFHCTDKAMGSSSWSLGMPRCMMERACKWLLCALGINQAHCSTFGPWFLVCGLLCAHVGPFSFIDEGVFLTEMLYLSLCMLSAVLRRSAGPMGGYDHITHHGMKVVSPCCIMTKGRGPI
ncbi:hypothetical protein DUNSADRAFT_15894 [Dunaliella salina]|uniref:Uncharacterized protein n=1 Tax=Dunaliella salina TaxID=3046 RepID=A0ABZ3KK69_DUNSA|nr:hypothetical protein DUNSADRAFT_15894 [Dunaliella salina]|eukprot:KAF5829567.1 hypothetical protein DUNSADRAFT_15894 [Dunaliella salina]